MTPAWFRDRDWRTGGYHAIGALGIQAAVAALLSIKGVPGFWWLAALAGGGFWVVREVWQMRRADPPVWWQNRTPWDVGTAVIPVLAVAIAMECLR
jgi:hypothetical protein